MWKRVCSVAACLALAAAVFAEEIPTTSPAAVTALALQQQWGPLIQGGKLDEAQALCSGWLEAPTTLQKVEAHKCLANVELSKAAMVMLDRGEQHGTLRSGFHGEHREAGIAHLESALKLDPKDLSVHQGRLHVLLTSSSYERALAAIKESVEIYREPDALDAWLDYCSYYFEASQFSEGVAFVKVLEEAYPDDHRVVANAGAFLTMSNRDDEARPYLERAVAMAPGDPLNNWNLGRFHDFTGNVEGARRSYVRALELVGDEATRQHWSCLFAEFLETKAGERERACALQKQHCAEGTWTACAPGAE